jgi:hypothetical protein
MEHISIQKLSTPKGEFLEPPESSKPITTSGYELRPDCRAMVREQPFSGFDDENPYHLLRGFEQLCSCLTIEGMAQETLWWKLFPFSLDERAKQWYAHNVGKVNREWDELRDRFYLAFFPISHIASLWKEILDFRQDEKETLGAARARFSQLTHAGPELSIPDHVLLQHFWLGLSKEFALQLDITVGGSFTHITTAEGEALLECILENASFTESLPVVEPSSHEEVPLIESAPLPLTYPDSSLEPSPELETMEEDLFDDFENISNYFHRKRPPVPVGPTKPLDKCWGCTLGYHLRLGTLFV